MALLVRSHNRHANAGMLTRDCKQIRLLSFWRRCFKLIGLGRPSIDQRLGACRDASDRRKSLNVYAKYLRDLSNRVATSSSDTQQAARRFRFGRRSDTRCFYYCRRVVAAPRTAFTPCTAAALRAQSIQTDRIPATAPVNWLYFIAQTPFSNRFRNCHA